MTPRLKTDDFRGRSVPQGTQHGTACLTAGVWTSVGPGHSVAVGTTVDRLHWANSRPLLVSASSTTTFWMRSMQRLSVLLSLATLGQVAVAQQQPQQQRPLPSRANVRSVADTSIFAPLELP